MFWIMAVAPGILAIAASKLGARMWLEWISIRRRSTASRQNALLNQCESTMCEFHNWRFGPDGKNGRKRRDQADVIVANILADPLIVLAPILTRAARPAADRAFGDITEQAEEVRASISARV